MCLILCRDEKVFKNDNQQTTQIPKNKPLAKNEGIPKRDALARNVKRKSRITGAYRPEQP